MTRNCENIVLRQRIDDHRDRTTHVDLGSFREEQDEQALLMEIAAMVEAQDRACRQAMLADAVAGDLRALQSADTTLSDWAFEESLLLRVAAAYGRLSGNV
jgi:hypothetical protein